MAQPMLPSPRTSHPSQRRIPNALQTCTDELSPLVTQAALQIFLSRVKQSHLSGFSSKTNFSPSNTRHLLVFLFDPEVPAMDGDCRQMGTSW